MTASPRVVVDHVLDRRVRLRVPALIGNRSACERVAEALAREPGCEVVRVRPLTGSILVECSEGRLDPERLRARLTELLCEVRDEAGQPLIAAHPGDHPGPTRVARAVAHAFVAINADVREALDHRADLGTIIPVVFVTAGLAEVATTGKLPAPAWFNLVWWSIRSFMTFNPDAVLDGAPNAGPGEGAAPVCASDPDGVLQR